MTHTHGMGAHESNLAELGNLLDRYREAAGRLSAIVECVSCGKPHKHIPRNYLGYERYACSDWCWDEWVNFGRYERPE